MESESLAPPGCSEERFRAAVHEVGHSVVGLGFNGSIVSFGLDRDGEGHCSVKLPPGKGTSGQLAFASMMMDYSGIVAERVVFGDAPDAMRPNWVADVNAAIMASKQYTADPAKQREIRGKARTYVETLLRPLREAIISVARMVAQCGEVDARKLMASLLPQAAAELQQRILKGK